MFTESILRCRSFLRKLAVVHDVENVLISLSEFQAVLCVIFLFAATFFSYRINMDVKSESSSSDHSMVGKLKP